jgi:hypothetical protein
MRDQRECGGRGREEGRGARRAVGSAENNRRAAEYAEEAQRKTRKRSDHVTFS